VWYGGKGGGVRDLVCVSEAKGKYMGEMLLYIRGTSDRLVSGRLGAHYVPKTYFMYVLVCTISR